MNSGPRHVAVNASFQSRPHTGSGQYLRHLLPALGAADPALRLSLIGGAAEARPGRRGEDVRKVLFEQATVPWRAGRLAADLLHVPYWASPAAAPVPVVVTIHDVIPALLPAYRGNALVRAYTRLVSATARRAARVIVDSQCSRRDAIRLLGLRPGRVDVAPLAADPRFRPLPAGAAAAICRRRWGLDGPFLLYVGGNDVRKNLPALLRAWGRAAAQLPGHALVLAGALRYAPPFFPDIPGLAAQLGLPRLRMLGAVTDDEKQALLAACAAFLWPSRYEGFGLPPLEAMQCGAPVISSNRSSMPEVVGDAGVLLDPDDAAALAEAMVRVGGDPAAQRRWREAGLARARAFSWAHTAALTLDSYRRAAAARH